MPEQDLTEHDNVQSITVDDVVDDYNRRLRKKSCCSKVLRRRLTVLAFGLIALVCFVLAALLKSHETLILIQMTDTRDRITVGLILVGSLFTVLFLFCIQLFYCHYVSYSRLTTSDSKSETELIISEQFDDV